MNFFRFISCSTKEIMNLSYFVCLFIQHKMCFNSVVPRVIFVIILKIVKRYKDYNLLLKINEQVEGLLLMCNDPVQTGCLCFRGYHIPAPVR